MLSTFQSLKRVLPVAQQASILSTRSIHCTAACMKTSAGKYKITRNVERPLTYEMANPPYQIQHRKTWNSFNCSNLAGGLRTSETSIEDIFIRKFIVGTFHALVCSEVIIKRQFNHIRIGAILLQKLPPRKFYFLIGYTEEILALWLHCPVTLEVQTITDRKETVFKYI